MVTLPIPLVYCIMRWCLLVLLVPLAVADTITFLNGDRLSGTATTTGSQQTLLWDSNVYSKVLPTPINQIDQIIFAPENQPAPSRHNERYVRVLLNRGDIYYGDLTNITHETITLHTTWAGEIQLNHRMVNKIEMLGLHQYFVVNGTDLTQWNKVMNRLMWTQKQTALYSRGRGGICRQVSLPKQFKTHINVSVSHSPRLRFLFLASEGSLYEPESYIEVVLLNSSIMARTRSMGDIELIGQINNIKELEKSREIKLTIYFDLEKRTLVGYLQDKQIGRWDLTDSIKLGDWLYLFSEYDGAITLNELTISSWNGLLPSSARLPHQQHEQILPEVALTLSNGDQMRASSYSFEGQAFQLTTPLGDASLPINRVNRIDLSRLPYDEAIRNLGDIRLLLHDGSEVTMQLLDWRNGIISGESQNSTPLKVLTEHLREIDFNLYRD